MRKIMIAMFAFVAASCATNPATGQRQLMLVSESQEIQMGKDADADVRKTMGVYDDAAWQAYVTTVGIKLARASHRPNLPWHFTVVDEPAVNAFALPGGFIYITRGILPYLRDEAELAAVLGHEVGHVDARHSASQVSKQQVAGIGIALGGALAPKYSSVFGLAGNGLGLLFLKYGRADELEAAHLGTGYAAAAGWDRRDAKLKHIAHWRSQRLDARRPNWALSSARGRSRQKVQNRSPRPALPRQQHRAQSAGSREAAGVVFGVREGWYAAANSCSPSCDSH